MPVILIENFIMKKIIVIFIKLLITGNLISQNCIDFTNLSQATCRYGSFNNPNEKTGVVNYGPNSMSSRHTVHTDITERDPHTNNQLRTIPNREQKSVRLGNANTGSEAESITYEYTVSQPNELLILKYAAVMEDPNHSASEQPRFTIKFLDATGQEINPSCLSYDFIASSALGWNNNNGVLWKDWTTVAIDVSEFVGQTIYVQLTTYDCSQGGHYGYAYFTLTCAKKQLFAAICNRDTTYYAPEGFDYHWYSQNNPAQILSTTNSLTVSDNRNYYCDCMFNDYCSFTLSILTDRDTIIAKFDTVTVKYCPLLEVQFNNHTEDNTQNTNSNIPINYRWDFNDGTTSTETDPVHTFDTEGTYTVRLTATIGDVSCTSEFSMEGISFTLPEVKIQTPLGTTFTCHNTEIPLIANEKDSTLSYVWSHTLETEPTVQVSDPGTYIVTITDNRGCANSTSVIIDETEPPSEVEFRARIPVNIPYQENGFDILPQLIPGFFTFEQVLTDRYGCDSVFTTLHLTVYDEIVPDKYFSPNGNGVKDLWNIQNIEYVELEYAEIYDRFGKLLIRYTDHFTPWDGVYNGRNMPSTDYWYVICVQYQEKQSYIYKGHFTLVR